MARPAWASDALSAATANGLDKPPRCNLTLPASLFFPAGIPDAIQSASSAANLKPDWMALLLFQLQKRLARRVLTEPFNAPEGMLVPMNAQVLKSMRRDYAKYMTAMQEHGIITLWVDYLVGSHSRLYKYHDDFDITGKQDLYWLTKTAAINALYRRHTAPADVWMAKRLGYLSAFEIDSRAALAWVRKLAPTKERPDIWLPYVEHAIEMLAEKHTRLTRDEFGREHSNMTNLPRYIRHNFIKHLGHSLVELDIPSSQPHMLYAVLREANKCQQDLPKFRQALRDDFYTFLCKQSATKMTRQEMKKAVMVYLFRDPKYDDSQVKDLFVSVFPQIHSALIQVKEKGGYQSVAQHLQRKESQIVFAACKSLTMGGQEPYFTVHDSIACLKEHVTLTDRSLVTELNRSGIDWITSLRST